MDTDEIAVEYQKLEDSGAPTSDAPDEEAAGRETLERLNADVVPGQAEAEAEDLAARAEQEASAQPEYGPEDWRQTPQFEQAVQEQVEASLAQMVHEQRTEYVGQLLADPESSLDPTNPDFGENLRLIISHFANQASAAVYGELEGLGLLQQMQPEERSLSQEEQAQWAEVDRAEQAKAQRYEAATKTSAQLAVEVFRNAELPIRLNQSAWDLGELLTALPTFRPELQGEERVKAAFEKAADEVRVSANPKTELEAVRKHGIRQAIMDEVRRETMRANGEKPRPTPGY